MTPDEQAVVDDLYTGMRETARICHKKARERKADDDPDYRWFEGADAVATRVTYVLYPLVSMNLKKENTSCPSSK